MNRSDFIKYMTAGSLFSGSFKLKALADQLNSGSETPEMPVLFLGHGSPMNAIESNVFSKNWKGLASELPVPRAIVCISAHWETKGTFVTAMPMPKTIHDFGGFPQALFDVQYPAAGSPGLAKEITSMQTSRIITEDHTWGLDHGTWSVLRNMYPDAQIPVIQLSLDVGLSAESHKELAESLSKLRQKGVLVIGSGNLVHNLGKIDWRNPENGFDWALEADDTFKKAISEENWNLLLAKTSWNAALRNAVPSAEHYLPMIYALAMKQNKERLRFFNENTVMGSISMRSFIIS